MVDHVDDMMLVLLRAIRGDVAEIKTDMNEVKERLGLFEATGASLSRRLERLGGDMDRVKVRLELHEAV